MAENSSQGTSLESVGFSVADLRRLVEECYADEATPLWALLQLRLRQRLGVRALKTEIRDVAETAYHALGGPSAGTSLQIIDTCGRVDGRGPAGFMVALVPPPESFRGFADAYMAVGEAPPAPLLREAAAHLLIGGWQEVLESSHEKYVIADWLRTRSKVLANHSYGAVSKIVRWFSCSNKQILGKRSGKLVPYPSSEEYEKCENARRLLPTGIRSGEAYVSSWEELCDSFKRLLLLQGGSVRIPLLKGLFRDKLGTELSETALGHTTMTGLLKDPRLTNIIGFDRNAETISWRGNSTQEGVAQPFRLEKRASAVARESSPAQTATCCQNGSRAPRVLHLAHALDDFTPPRHDRGICSTDRSTEKRCASRKHIAHPAPVHIEQPGSVGVTMGCESRCVPLCIPGLVVAGDTGSMIASLPHAVDARPLDNALSASEARATMPLHQQASAPQVFELPAWCIVQRTFIVAVPPPDACDCEPRPEEHSCRRPLRAVSSPPASPGH